MAVSATGVGSLKIRYTKCKRRRRFDVFVTIMTELALKIEDAEMVMIGATHRTSTSIAVQ